MRPVSKLTYLPPPIAALSMLLAGCFSDTPSGTGTSNGTGTSAGSTSGTSTSGTSAGSTSAGSTTMGPNSCGDAQVDPGEECDLGAGNTDNGGCTASCTLAKCGDGLVYIGQEACDEGEETATCDADCTPVMCGDGTANAAAGEACDDGEGNGPGQACREDCTANVCGDNDVGPGEECDDGEMNDDNGLCKTDCKAATCGDGFVSPAEGCDDGNTMNGDGCSATCLSEECGDGVVQAPEECDDGNQNSQDGCTALCKFPKCGDNFVQPGNGEECDEGAANSNTGTCTASCKLPICGDNFTQADEECDDGNQSNADLCTNSCTKAACGDGFLQPVNGEGCDDGNLSFGDGCDENCMPYYTVFVTSGTLTGNIGGPEAADAFCRELATTAKLPNPSTYVAWVSSGQSAVQERFAVSDNERPFVMPDGTFAFANADQILSGGTPNAPINVNETGNVAGKPFMVWTGTIDKGEAWLVDCGGWTADKASLAGGAGDSTLNDSQWTKASEPGCDSKLRLYCFEQG